MTECPAITFVVFAISGCIHEIYDDIYYFYLQISTRKYPKLKEVDDVLGGAAAWENVDHTEGMLLFIYS